MKKPFYRRIWVWILALLALLAVLACFGSLPARLVDRLARGYLESSPYQVHWSGLTGNLRSGFQAQNLSLETSDGTSVARLDDVRLALKGFEGAKPRLALLVHGGSLSLEGVKKFLAELPKSQEPSGDLPFVFAPLQVTNLKGSDLPWQVEALTLEEREGLYHLDGKAQYQTLPLTVAGTLGSSLTEPHMDVTLHALGGQAWAKGDGSEFNLQGQGFDLSALKELWPQTQVSGGLDFDGHIDLVNRQGGGKLALHQVRGFGSELGDGTVTAQLKGDVLALENVDLRLFGAPVTAQGHLTLTDEMPLYLDGSVGKYNGATLGKKLPTKGLDQLGLGLESGVFHLEGPLGALNGFAKLRQGWLNWQGLKVQNMTAQLDLAEGKPRGWATGKALDGDVSLKLMSAEPLSLDVNLQNVELAGLKVVLPDMPLGGRAKVKAHASGDPSNPALTLDASAQHLAFRDLFVDALSLKGQGTAQEFVVRPLSARLFGGTVDGEVVAQNLFGAVKAQFALKGQDLTAEGLNRGLPFINVDGLARGNAFEAQGKFDSSRGTQALEGSASLKIPGIEYGPLKARDLTAQAAIAEGKLTVGKLDGIVLGAPLHAQGVMPLDAEGAVDATVEWQGFDLALAHPQATGKANLELKAQGPLKSPIVDARLESEHLAYGPVGFRQVAVTAQGEGPWQVTGSALGPGDAPLTLAGSVNLSEEGPMVDGDVTLRGIDANALVLGQAEVTGPVDAKAHVTGLVTNPTVTLNAQSPQLTAYGFEVPKARLDGTFKDKKLEAQASAEFGGGTLQAKAQGDLAQGLSGRLSVEGRGLELVALAPQQNLEGKMNVDASLQLGAEGLSGTGQVTSPVVKAQGYEVKDILLPFALKANTFNLDKGKATFAGAPVHLWAKGDISTLAFDFGAQAHGLDMTALTQPLPLPGKVTGAIDVDVAGQSHKSITYMADVKATVKGENIEIKDVPYMKLVTSGAPVRIRSALLTLAIGTDEVFLLPGSSLSAWPDDPVFKYVTLSGPLWRRAVPKNIGAPAEILKESRDTIKLAVLGNINLKALNSLLGGMGVLLNTVAQGGAIDARQLAGDLVGGLFAGAKDQFRDVSFVLAGPYDDLRVDDLNVAHDLTFDDPNDWAYGGRKLKEKGRVRSDVYTLKFEIPVGPGEGKGKSIQNQATGQVLNAIINSLVPENW